MTDTPELRRFYVGQKVLKSGGDYRFEGVVVGEITKLSGKIRYAVENAGGVLHIFSPQQLFIIDDIRKEYR